MRGFVHLYNNSFDNGTTPGGTSAAGRSQSQYNANQIGSSGLVYSENNSFFKTNQSNQVGLDDSSHAAYSFCERSNTYNQTTGSSVTGAGFPGSLPFGYSNAGPH
jgi:pectate lyase